MQFQPLQLVDHEAVRPRQEGGAHPLGHGAEPEIEAWRLDLVRIERTRRDQRPVLVKGSRSHGREVCLASANCCFRFAVAVLLYPAGQLTQAERDTKADLSRGDLAGRLAATLNKSLKWGRVSDRLRLQRPVFCCLGIGT